MGSIGEIWIVLIIVVVLFGAKALPKLAKSIGQAKKEFQNGLDEGADDADSARAAK
jgi:sec-independent protein translocase protein TatA